MLLLAISVIIYKCQQQAIAYRLIVNIIDINE